MTRFLLRLLLLSVLFNTVIGLPAHELRHWKQATEVAAADLTEDGTPVSDEAHDLCDWCHAYAQALAMAPAWAEPPSPTVTTDRFAAPATASQDRSARPWTFASRDPPRA